MHSVHRSFTMLPLMACATLACADPATTSSYFTDPQSSHVEDATSKGIGQVNMIACIMAAMRPDALVNQGDYNALVDESKCQPSGDGGSSSGSGGDAAQAATFMTATVNASRVSNSEPMISKIWIVQEEEGKQTGIDVHVSAAQPPSAARPYGGFRLDFCGKRTGLASCRMNGYLEGSDTGIRYFETETRDDGNGLETQTTALQLNASGTTSGSGRMQIDSSSGQGAFDFAYNANLYRRFDGTQDQCFSRDANDAATGFSVWRYGLYDAVTGARVTRNSGFPIEYTSGSQTYHGYLGYYGLQLPTEALDVLTSGSTVQKAVYSGGNQAPAKMDYTVVKAAGKLLKFTLRTRTLLEIDRIKFTTFVGMGAGSLFAGAAPNTQYELYWDNAAGDFKVTGQMNCSDNGCQTVALDTVQSVPASFWQGRGGVQGWSQSLGGEVFIKLQNVSLPLDSSSVMVAYRTQDLVYPSQLPATLYCLRDCPTNATLTGYFAGVGSDSPFAGGTFNNWSPTAAGAVVSYHTDSDTALLLDAAGQAVTFSDAAAIRQHPQYQHGVRTGRLFVTLADAECALGSGTYCDYKVNDLQVYYQWETGANSYSQFAAVKDSDGEFLKFDAPLQVTFNVPDTAAYGDYAGQSLVLQYGGYGDLWGIPGHCVSRTTNEPANCDGGEARYVPAFVIPFDTLLGTVSDGSTSYLVKWLEREIRFAHKDVGECTTAGLVVPSGMTLPTAADLKNPSDPDSSIYIGVKPVVTAAPRVIHGDVMY